MKKIVLSLALFIAGISTIVAQTPTKYATISMGASQISVLEGTTWSDAFDNGFDAYQYNKTGLAIVSGGTRYAAWATNELDNIEIEVALTAPVTSDVTLTFSNVIGDIHMNFNGTEVVLTDGGSITLPATDFGTDGKYSKSLKITKAVTPEFCFRNEVLTVNGYAGKTLKISKDGTDVVAEFTLGDTYEYDFSAAAAGRYVVTFDGKEYQIDVKPAVTVVP